MRNSCLAVLMVEDESGDCRTHRCQLAAQRFQADLGDGQRNSAARSGCGLPDLILLDWMLPGESGLTLAKRWRADARTKGVPIIMLTARGDEADRVAGLDAGADDYIAKPFSTKELAGTHSRRAAPAHTRAGR
jgi:two-component system phosphate regulon response regulator PhoB